VLTVAAQGFSKAGKGGAIALETRGNGGAVVSLATLAQKDVASGTEFEKITTDIRAALQASAPAQS
jgi:hypothetical protein